MLIFDAVQVFFFHSSNALCNKEQLVWFSVHLSSNPSIYGKNHIYQQCTSYPFGFKQSVGNTFSSNLET